MKQTEVLDLLRLNHPTPPSTEAKALSIKLGGAEDCPVVWGITKKRLTSHQYRVVKALIDAHPDRLSKDELANRSKTEDPVKMLDRLRKDQDWADALDKPGQPHGGYGIRQTRPSEPSKTTRPKSRKRTSKPPPRKG